MLEQAARTEAGDAGRLTASLQDLVSDLDLDQVLAKVTRNAQVAVGLDLALSAAPRRGRGAETSA